MKPEKEYRYIILLLNSQHVKSIFSTIPACKKQLQILLGAPENNKEFNEWLNYLIAEGSLEYHEDIKIGKNIVKGYLINVKILDKRLQKNILFNPTLKYIRQNKTAFGF